MFRFVWNDDNLCFCFKNEINNKNLNIYVVGSHKLKEFEHRIHVRYGFTILCCVIFLGKLLRGHVCMQERTEIDVLFYIGVACKCCKKRSSTIKKWYISHIHLLQWQHISFHKMLHKASIFKLFGSEFWAVSQKFILSRILQMSLLFWNASDIDIIRSFDILYLLHLMSTLPNLPQSSITQFTSLCFWLCMKLNTR